MAQADKRIGKVWTLNHGNSWTVYFKDPEDNTVECYVTLPGMSASRTAFPSTSPSPTRRSGTRRTASLANPTYMTAEAYRKTIVDRLAARPQ